MVTAEIEAIRRALFTLDFSQCMLNVLATVLHTQNPMKHSSFLIMIVKVMTYQLQAPNEDNNFKRNARKQGLLKSLIKLYKEILVANLQGVMPGKCAVELEVLTRLMWMFTVFLRSAKKIKTGETNKDVQYFVVKGGLTLASKIVIERQRMPEYIRYRAPELLKACMAVIA